MFSNSYFNIRAGEESSEESRKRVSSITKKPKNKTKFKPLYEIRSMKEDTRGELSSEDEGSDSDS